MQGSLEQRRRIINIIGLNLSYKDKEFNIELKPVFETIIKNTYKLTAKNDNNRTRKNSATIDVEADCDTDFLNRSPGWTRTNNLPVNS